MECGYERNGNFRRTRKFFKLCARSLTDDSTESGKCTYRYSLNIIAESEKFRDRTERENVIVAGDLFARLLLQLWFRLCTQSTNNSG